MIIEHSGWSQERGNFCDKYLVDTNRIDMIIKWTDGKECKQVTPFKLITSDWNNDNDIYALFGASFEDCYAIRTFYTPSELVDLIVDGKATIDGIRRI